MNETEMSMIFVPRWPISLPLAYSHAEYETCFQFKISYFGDSNECQKQQRRHVSNDEIIIPILLRWTEWPMNYRVFALDSHCKCANASYANSN